MLYDACIYCISTNYLHQIVHNTYTLSTHYLHTIYTLSTQLICCNDYTELGTMRLSVELPGLLVAGPDSAQDLLGTVAAAARNLNIPTTQVSSRAVNQGS